MDLGHLLSQHFHTHETEKKIASSRVFTAFKIILIKMTKNRSTLHMIEKIDHVTKHNSNTLETIRA